MASDKKRYNESLSKWDDLHKQQLFSVPREVGKTAIFCSYAVIDLIGNRAYKKGRKDVSSFRKEAFSIADRLAEQKRSAEVILNASDNDFNRILQDNSFSDIVTVGHGNLSTLVINDEDKLDYPIDWYDLSNYTDHLKTGYFIQRQCGTFGRDLSVPLGMFCVSRHCDVIATVGLAFNPKGLDHPANNTLDYATDQERLNYRLAKATFCY